MPYSIAGASIQQPGIPRPFLLFEEFGARKPRKHEWATLVKKNAETILNKRKTPRILKFFKLLRAIWGYICGRHWRPQAVSAPVVLGSRADAEHLGPASRTYTLSGRLAVLHGNALGVPDFLLGSALNAIGFHHTPHYG